MLCFLMSAKAISQSLVSPSISQLTGFQIQPKIHKEMNFRDLGDRAQEVLAWMNLRI